MADTEQEGVHNIEVVAGADLLGARDSSALTQPR
jgi:hypothetical protein